MDAVETKTKQITSSDMWLRVVSEGLLSGVVVLIVVALVYWVLGAVIPDQRHWKALIIVGGVLITHLLFEATGWNKKFCDMLPLTRVPEATEAVMTVM